MRSSLVATPRGANLSHLSTSGKFINASQLRSRTVNRQLAPSVRASVVVTDEKSGVEFNFVQKFWIDETPFRCLGAGLRVKKILFLPVQLYSIALYVEADKATNELNIRDRGGFFENDDDYCCAIVDGAFNKVLTLEMLRDIEGEQFTDALNKYLVPRMQLTGEMSKLEEFAKFFNSRKLTKGTRVNLLWNIAVKKTECEISVVIADPPASGSKPVSPDSLSPQLSVQSPSFSRALFETFLGESSVVPDVRSTWVEGVKKLLESENTTRATR